MTSKKGGFTWFSFPILGFRLCVVSPEVVWVEPWVLSAAVVPGVPPGLTEGLHPGAAMEVDVAESEILKASIVEEVDQASYLKTKIVI